MPPKRKRDTETTEIAPTRSTRSSTRQSAASTSTKDASPPPVKKSTRKKKTEDATEAAPAPKKAKTASKPKKGKKTADDVKDNGDTDSLKLDETQSKSQPTPTLPPVSTPPAPVLAPVLTIAPKPTATAAPPPPKPAPSKIEPYSPERAAALFKKYCDEDDPNVIGPEGLERFCADANIPLEGSLPLILAWQLDAKEMGKFTKEEWTKGTDTIRISSLPQLAMFVADLEQLLTTGKSPAKSGKKDPYDRSAIGKYAADPQAAFQTFYSYSFNYAKPEQSRNIDMETSVALWSVLLVSQYPIMSEVLEFIAEKPGTYKATNKDLWSMMLEFCRTIKPSLQGYEADGAWPTLLDDFVEWKKNGQGTGSQ